MRPEPSPNDPLNRAGYQCVFVETFDKPELDTTRWVTDYLPHWTTPERAAARYELHPGLLRLRIDADQPAWRVEDGELRASNIQTGTFSGPLGSAIGQHRYRPDLTVVSTLPAQRLYLPSAAHGSCLVEAELKATDDPTVMLALWLIGFEDAPERSGELCVCELFGHAIGTSRSAINIGVKAHNDPHKRDDMQTVELTLDATAWHTYSVEWTKAQANFYIDDHLIRTVSQGFDYPMQVMIDLFEDPDSTTRISTDYPKTGEVRGVRGFTRDSQEVPSP